jgi:hypothetical protein
VDEARRTLARCPGCELRRLEWEPRAGYYLCENCGRHVSERASPVFGASVPGIGSSNAQQLPTMYEDSLVDLHAAGSPTSGQISVVYSWTGPSNAVLTLVMRTLPPGVAAAAAGNTRKLPRAAIAATASTVRRMVPPNRRIGAERFGSEL